MTICFLIVSQLKQTFTHNTKEKRWMAGDGN